MKVLSGALLVAGTAIGAGMLGIPLVTGGAGFLPAFVMTLIVWLFMLATGYLFLEVTLWMHHVWFAKEANVISMTKKFLGDKYKYLTGGMFAFLYYCLMVAYFSAGAPLVMNPLGISGATSFLAFGLIMGFIVWLGLGFIDRLNYILMLGLVLSYFFLVGTGIPVVDTLRLKTGNWSLSLLSLPVLFSAFGYHNIIPSLTTHFGGDSRIMRRSIFWGTFISLVVYLVWQWVIIGSVPADIMQKTKASGLSVTSALQGLTGVKWLIITGDFFAFFAIVTSLLGVAFSMVDFLGDAFDIKRRGKGRFLLCLLTFTPPFIFTALNPNIFLAAISVAGGFGEAFLNGILPAWLVWIGRYKKGMSSAHPLPGGKFSLGLILIFGFFVMALETLFILR